MKAINLSAISGSLAERAADIGTEIVLLIKGKKPVAAIVPLKGLDPESIQLSGHPEFLKIIARSRAQFRRGQIISLADMKAAFSKNRSPNRALQPTSRARPRAKPGRRVRASRG